jgi:hypothetical protein
MYWAVAPLSRARAPFIGHMEGHVAKRYALAAPLCAPAPGLVVICHMLWNRG